MVYSGHMPRRKHLPLPVLLALSLACALMAGALIQVRRPDIGQQAVQAQIEARTPRERCDRLGDEWTFVTRTNPDVSLCYKTAWGFPQFTSSAPVEASGDPYVISFSQPVGSPVLYFDAPSVLLSGKGTSTSLSWTLLDPTSPQEDLQTFLNTQYAEVFTVGGASFFKRSFFTESGGMIPKVQYIVAEQGWRMFTDVEPDYVDDIETMLRASL